MTIEEMLETYEDWVGESADAKCKGQEFQPAPLKKFAPDVSNGAYGTYY